MKKEARNRLRIRNGFKLEKYKGHVIKLTQETRIRLNRILSLFEAINCQKDNSLKRQESSRIRIIIMMGITVKKNDIK